MDDKKRSGRPEGSPYHIPVLLDETIKAMNIRDDGIYLDATAGGGGHSFEIASRLTTGRLIALDQDPDAVKEASRRLEGLNAEVVRSNFAMMEQVLHDRGIFSVDGILMDIGVSSHQLDAPERGFSYHADAPLDMRMSQEGTTAAELVNTLDEKQLAEIFFRFGEEKYARPIARSIVRERVGQPIETTAMLSEIVKNSVPASYRRDGHPARKVFQALRIAVNRELDCLSLTLDTAFSLLKTAEGLRLSPSIHLKTGWLSRDLRYGVRGVSARLISRYACVIAHLPPVLSCESRLKPRRRNLKRMREAEAQNFVV